MIAVQITSIVADDPSGGLDRTRTRMIVEGTLTLSGNYGTGSSHGDTVNFAQFDQIKSGQPPVWVEVHENQGAGSAALGYTYIYQNGATQGNGVLTILGGAAASGQGGAEITQGSAYSGFTPSLNGAVLRFRAAFPWGV
jgi:hypothetical protein